MEPMTSKQEAFLLSLCNKVTGNPCGYLSQHRDFLGLSSSKMSRGLTKAEATAMISKLKKQAD